MQTLQIEVSDPKVVALSLAERQEWQERCVIIRENFVTRNLATSAIMQQASEILKKKLWREDYESEDHFLRSTFNIEEKFLRKVFRANRDYLYLVNSTEDPEEQLTLKLLKESSFRELRRLASEEYETMRIGNESSEDHRVRLDKHEAESQVAIKTLWDWIYPKIKAYKLESRTGLFPGGGFTISKGDIISATAVLQNLLAQDFIIQNCVTQNSKIELDGRDIYIDEMVNASEEANADPIEVMEALSRLGVAEILNEKLLRQREHIRSSLEQVYFWDKYEGTCSIINGRLVIKNQLYTYDMINELSDLINEDIVLSVRRVKRDL